ncbi:MAG: hypothetical protein MJ177_02505 [Clostridia bacterium]|nr:hypothetical protein [Clostridia bacterium]
MMVAVIKNYDIQAIKHAVCLAEKHEKFKINGLFAGEIHQLKKDAPELYGKVNELISVGRWNPCAGMWSSCGEKISEEALCRNILYSAQELKKEYHVFYGVDYYNASLAKCVYAGRFDAAIIEAAKQNHWLECADGSRVLVLAADSFTDVLSLNDEKAKENEFMTFEEYSKAVLLSPLDLPTVKSGFEPKAYTDDEKKLLDFERAAVQKKEDVREQVKALWLSREKCTADVQPKDNVKIDVSGVELVAFKLAEDGTGDTVIRVRETDGRETPVRLICDDIEAAFRFEILPYETITFRVDAQGYVTETFIQE